jgi:hypothetical protein
MFPLVATVASTDKRSNRSVERRHPMLETGSMQRYQIHMALKSSCFADTGFRRYDSLAVTSSLVHSANDWLTVAHSEVWKGQS